MNANLLKIIAMISMTIDHAGMMLYPEQKWMRMVGRIAFPIFAFMIAEGCRYTHDRKKYFCQIAGIGIAMQIVYYIAMGSLYQSVFISFSLAILLIYAIDQAKKEQKIKYWIYAGLTAGGIAFLTLLLPEILSDTDYAIDYGVVGIAIPILCYYAKERKTKVAVFTIGLVALSIACGGVQWCGLAAVPLAAFYNGQRGRWKLKTLFYVYYPLHLAALYLLSM